MKPLLLILALIAIALTLDSCGEAPPGPEWRQADTGEWFLNDSSHSGPSGM